MIYLDTCYILKCYLTEQGSKEVRMLTASAEGLASCVLARAEFAAAVHRHLREGRLTGEEARGVFRNFREDEKNGYWNWHALTDNLIERVATCFEALPATVFLRTADAMHLCCAQDAGFREIHSNDRHLLAAASGFGLRGVDVIR